MATFTSMVSSSSFKSRTFLNCTFRHQYTTFLHNQTRQTSCKPTRKLIRAQFRVPDDKLRFDMIKEKLWQSLPDSAKTLEWKKAGDVLQHQLLFLGRKTLVWLFITWFGFSCISDAIYSIYMNKELLMPLGLLAGCLLTDFLKETALELSSHSKEMDFERHLVGIGCFCVLLKLVSLLLPVQGRVFLLHVANGGMLQVLWLWRSSLKEVLRID